MFPSYFSLHFVRIAVSFSWALSFVGFFGLILLVRSKVCLYLGFPSFDVFPVLCVCATWPLFVFAIFYPSYFLSPNHPLRKAHLLWGQQEDAVACSS